MPPRVLVISAAPVGDAMVGPAIRAREFARALEPHADVTLAGIDPGTDAGRARVDVAFRQRDPRLLRDHVLRADAIVCQPLWPAVARWARRGGARLIYALDAPEPLELLAHRSAGGGAGARNARLDPAKIALWSALTLDRITTGLADGHHFLCASEKQRDLRLGAMMGEGLLRPAAYRRDPTLRDVIDVVPFGVPSQPPVRSPGPGLRGRFPGIGPGDEVVLWNGGIWNWLDAPTAVRAVGMLAQRRPGVKLVFMGVANDVQSREATAAARAAASEHGLLDDVVFFNDTWVPYDERGDWLLDAAVAVSTHHAHLETRFAFRTRLLDCFWAGLPVVCTEGDDLAARVAQDGLGATAAPEDADGLAGALGQVLDRGRPAYADALAAAAADHAWPRVTEPVVRYVTAASLPPRLGAGLPKLRHPGRVARGLALSAAGVVQRLR
jgi:glycosyltransferase involved in cell wall biosynthesis